MMCPECGKELVYRTHTRPNLVGNNFETEILWECEDCDTCYTQTIYASKVGGQVTEGKLNRFLFC